MTDTATFDFLATRSGIQSRVRPAADEVERDMGFTIETYAGDAALSLVRRLLPAGIAAKLD